MPRDMSGEIKNQKKNVGLDVMRKSARQSWKAPGDLPVVGACRRQQPPLFLLFGGQRLAVDLHTARSAKRAAGDYY